MRHLWLILCLLPASVAVLAISALFVDPKREYDRNSRYYRFLVNISAAVGICFAGVRLKVQGMENLPKKGRFLLVCNHRSNFDPLITMWALRKYDPAFVSKPENFKIPIFGRLIRKCCFMAIDRQNPRNALQTVRRAQWLLRNDRVSVALYPEGTRSKSGELLPFKNGALKVATQTGVPIVTAVICGTENIHKNFPRKATPIVLEILSVREPVGTTVALGQEIRQEMLENIERIEGNEKIPSTV